MDMIDTEELFQDHQDRQRSSSPERYENDENRNPDDPNSDQDQDQQSQSAQLELNPDKVNKSEENQEEKKKRVIRNPQPKLNPDRLCGPKRGIRVIENMFKNFKHQGSGKEFEDLDIVMKKMEYWANRLYPKLPSDDVMERIGQLGKKKTVQYHVKRIRLNELNDDNDDEQNAQRYDDNDEEETLIRDVENQEDRTQRYEDNVEGDFPNDEEFDRIMREAEETQRLKDAEEMRPTQIITDEQREIMKRNREKAEERRKLRLSQMQESQVDSQTQSAEDNSQVPNDQVQEAVIESEVLSQKGNNLDSCKEATLDSQEENPRLNNESDDKDSMMIIDE